MFPPSLTVIECDNPDDQYTDAGHLALVPDPSGQSPIRPLPLKIVDIAIDVVIIRLFWWQLEALRTRLEAWYAVERKDGTIVPRIGRGW